MLTSAGDAPPCGVASSPTGPLRDAVLAAWDEFLAVVEDPRTDLSRPSRLPGWSGRDVLVHLGSWPGAVVVDALLASAAGPDEDGAATDPDEGNARQLREHAGASTGDVVAALHASRERLVRYFGSGEVTTWGRRPARSSAGPLPVSSLVHAGCFELAVHALDLAPCGAPPPGAHLLDRGLAALVDVTGALAARNGVVLTLTGQAPAGGWTFASDGTGWTTRPHRPGPFDGVGVRGSAVDLLETASGRSNLATMVLTRRLVVQQLPQWMRLAPLLDDLPGLPGGSALKGAVGGVSGVAGGVGKVLGRLGRRG